MRILVLSDNHYKKISFNPSDFDAIIHAGDRGNMRDYLEASRAYYVDGNCDSGGEKIRVFSLFNKKILLTHGDLYKVKYRIDSLIYKAMEENVDFCIYGHTHVPSLFTEEGITFLNPGAYKDGYYVIITDENIEFYLNDKVIKSIAYRW